MGYEDDMARYLNELTEHVLYTTNRQVALDIFEWDGLPPGLSTDILEEMLYEHGQVIWFKRSNGGVTVLKGTPTGQRNIYNQPVAYDVKGVDFQTTVSVDKSVRMKNNPMILPTRSVLEYFCFKMTRASRVTDNHIEAHQVARVITTDDEKLLTAKNIIKKLKDGVFNIFANKRMDLDKIDVLDLEIQFIANDMMDYQNAVENKLNTFLGINNANTDKKERLITDEVNANDDAIGRNIAYMLRSRKEAVEEINEMFDLNVSVKIKHQTKPAEPKEDEDADFD